MTARLVFFSDFICPWCYVAERGTLNPVREAYDLTFEWRGFELHPGIPKGGMSIASMLPKAHLDTAHARLKGIADGYGIPFEPRDHAPSTKPALAIAEYARSQDRLDAWREAGMNAHWRDGRNIEDPAVLRELAVEAGLDPDAAIAFLDRPEVPQILAAQREEAQRWGVTGIPTWFVLPSGWNPGDPMPPEGQPRPVKVVGAQPRDVVERACRLAGARPLD
jgi:predicted DsbA family dithiol-disulfide isomerase